MIFKTSLDTLAKGVTISVTILFAAVIIAAVIGVKGNKNMVAILVAVILLLLYVGIYLFRPLRYSVTPNQLIIHRPLNNIKIEREKILSIEQVDREKLKWTIRTFGVGGLFGYWGQFLNTKMGPMTWYATRRNKAVLINTSRNEKILLTPDKPEEFIDALSAYDEI